MTNDPTKAHHILQTHAAYAVRQQSPTSLSFTHVNARVRSGIYTRTGELHRNSHRTPHSDAYPISLQEWLAHSKKKTCDVCKYPYSFTKGESASSVWKVSI